jgi:hypothetical protein
MTIEVRRYPSEAVFSTDASTMAAAGWQIAAQATGSAMSGSGQLLVALGVIAAIVGWLAVGAVGLAIGIVMFIMGVASRSQTYTVTYRYEAATDRRQPAGP